MVQIQPGLIIHICVGLLFFNLNNPKDNDSRSGSNVASHYTVVVGTRERIIEPGFLSDFQVTTGISYKWNPLTALKAYFSCVFLGVG